MADAETFVEMLVSSGTDSKIQWFEYRPGFFSSVTRLEWDVGTMYAGFPSDIASYLVSKGYARRMTDEEIEKYTAPDTSQGE